MVCSISILPPKPLISRFATEEFDSPPIRAAQAGGAGCWGAQAEAVRAGCVCPPLRGGSGGGAPTPLRPPRERASRQEEAEAGAAAQSAPLHREYSAGRHRAEAQGDARGGQRDGAGVDRGQSQRYDVD
eukprot:1181179-Prorocentrum_minimum.AAC.2